MATTADADLILRLYDLRREPLCRQARAWLTALDPASPEQARAICSDLTRQDNAWLRQVTSYWEMAFSIANCGAVDETLFAKNCGEGIFYCCKCLHLKARFAEAWTRGMPEAEAFLARNAVAQEKAAFMRKRMGWG